MNTEPDLAPDTRPIGRPRDEAIEQKVLRAAVELLHGKPVGEDFTLAELVERSGTSRAAIYRRWENRQAIVVAALDADRRPVAKVECGSLLETLLASYDQMHTEIEAGGGHRLINKRLVLGLKDPALQREYWERHVRRRRAETLQLLEDGKAAGEIRADADLDVVLDLINGAAYYQGVVRGDWSSAAARDRIQEAIRTVFRGIAAEEPDGRS